MRARFFICVVQCSLSVVDCCLFVVVCCLLCTFYVSYLRVVRSLRVVGCWCWLGVVACVLLFELCVIVVFGLCMCSFCVALCAF